MKNVLSVIKGSAKAQALILLLIAVAAADAGFYLLRAKPVTAEVSSLEKRLRDVNGQMRKDEDEYGIYSSFESGRDQLARFKGLLPRRSEYAEMIRRVMKLAREDGMKNTSFGSEKREAEEGGMTQVSFSMPITGRYREVRKFIYDVENAPVFLNINSMSLTTDASGEEIMMTLALTTYMRS